MHNGHMRQEIDIASFRTDLGWSQAKMAEKFGVDQATVSRWETKGGPKSGSARKLLDRLWVDALLAKQETKDSQS